MKIHRHKVTGLFASLLALPDEHAARTAAEIQQLLLLRKHVFHKQTPLQFCIRLL